MCLKAVEHILASDELLRKLKARTGVLIDGSSFYRYLRLAGLTLVAAGSRKKRVSLRVSILD